MCPYRRQFQVFSDSFGQFTADPAAVLVLGGDQRLDQRRTFLVLRKFGDPLIMVSCSFVLSACSAIYFSEYQVQGTDDGDRIGEHMPPGHFIHTGKWAKPGARKCARNGLLAPSETR